MHAGTAADGVSNVVLEEAHALYTIPNRPRHGYIDMRIKHNSLGPLYYLLNYDFNRVIMLASGGRGDSGV